VIVTGGWQTSKESAYVEASRARHGSEWFLARDELGAEGQDERRIVRLAGMMRQSGAQTPSLAHREMPDRDWLPTRDPLRLRSVLSPARRLFDARHRDAPVRGVDRGR
jgi:hypothetical protein